MSCRNEPMDVDCEHWPSFKKAIFFSFYHFIVLLREEFVKICKWLQLFTSPYRR